MFYYLNGTVASLEENLAVIDCGGVGFACNTTTYTLSSLNVGQKAMLYTYCNIREDAFDIFGFASREELSCFRNLLGVSGVGPKAALAILSAMTPDKFILAVLTGDEKALTVANGVGKKMAQRVILELKDKLGAQQQSIPISSANIVTPVSGSKTAEASAALATLGYSQSEIGLALKGLDVEHLPVEEIVRLALRAMISK
jgi:Holliday junction DNA helicase RuvA